MSENKFKRIVRLLKDTEKQTNKIRKSVHNKGDIFYSYINKAKILQTNWSISQTKIT